MFAMYLTCAPVESGANVGYMQCEICSCKTTSRSEPNLKGLEFRFVDAISRHQTNKNKKKKQTNKQNKQNKKPKPKTKNKTNKTKQPKTKPRETTFWQSHKVSYLHNKWHVRQLDASRLCKRFERRACGDHGAHVELASEKRLIKHLHLSLCLSSIIHTHTHTHTHTHPPQTHTHTHTHTHTTHLIGVSKVRDLQRFHHALCHGLLDTTNRLHLVLPQRGKNRF